MQNDVSDEPAPQKCHICEAPMVLVSNPGGDGHLSDAAHLQMHGLQVRHGGDGQDALIPIDGFADYAVARNAVIASKLGERAKTLRQANKLHRRSPLFAGARMLTGANIDAHA